MANLEFTGERILPEVGGYFFREHLARYKLARSFIEKNDVVLDVGSGEGYGTYILSHSAKNIFGIDISKAAIDSAAAKYQRKNLIYENVDPDNWKLNHTDFDVAVCFEVFEHVPKPEELIQKINDILKTSGLLIISTPNKEVYGDNLPDPYHVTEYSLREFKDVVERYFDVIEIKGQRNSNQFNKALNFWIARQSMKHLSIMRVFNLLISKKRAKKASIERLMDISTKANYFSNENPESADYFVLIAKKRR